jgi:glycerophosphoryl diester phosphodiesterase
MAIHSGMKWIPLVGLLLFTSCLSTKHMNSSLPSFDKEGHRGCRGLMPENTWPAFKKALDLGVTTLEMDAVITSDKLVVISHDPWFESEITTLPNGSLVQPEEARNYNIFHMPYAEVKKFDVGMKPHPRFPHQEKLAIYKPLLSEVIDSVSHYMKSAKRPYPFFNIETKSTPEGDGIFHPGPAEFVELIMSVIKEKGIEKHVIIQSFDYRTLQYLHLHYPQMKTAMLVEDLKGSSLEKELEKLGFTPTIFSPDYSLVDAAMIQSCHQKGIRIIPWTVNDKNTMEQFIKMGVDGLISDYPDLYAGVPTNPVHS